MSKLVYIAGDEITYDCLGEPELDVYCDDFSESQDGYSIGDSNNTSNDIQK